MLNNICNWGIIGAGDVCEKKGGPPLYRVDGCQLIGVTRRDRSAGEDYARRHGPSRYFESVEALLADTSINCIYVASPPDLHAEHTLAAARAGKHVFCEKPMAVDTAECSQMVEACRELGVSLAVAFYRRGYPSIQRARQLLHEGVIGELRSIELNTQFPISHRMDLVQFFCGDAFQVGLETPAEGGPILVGETSLGAQLRTSLGFEERDRPEQVRLVGRKGSIFVDDLKGGSLLLIKEAKEDVRESFAPPPATHWGLVENFRDHLARGIPLDCDGETGRKTSVVLDHVSNLRESGECQRVDYSNPPAFDLDQGRAFKLLA
jgi:predicted dehydrogenase